MDPAVRVQHPQCHEDVGGDLGRPVRRQRLLGQQCGQRARGHELAHYPQRTALGEHVEDLVQPGMVGDPRRGLRRLDRPPYSGVAGPARARTRRGSPPRPTLARIACRETVGQPLGVQHLRLDDLRQRHLPDEDFLPAVGVEGAGLGEFVLVGGRQRQAVAVGEHPTRIVVHVASPGRPVGQFRSPCVPFPTHDQMRSVRKHSRYVPEATRKVGLPDLTPQSRPSRAQTEFRSLHDFGLNESVNVFQVSLRSSLSQFEAFAVYISACPSWSFTTNPRSIVRYFVPRST